VWFVNEPLTNHTHDFLAVRPKAVAAAILE